MKRNTRLVLLMVGALLFAAAFVVMVVGGGNPKARLAVHFVAYTNPPGWSQDAAMFLITNESLVSLSFFAVLEWQTDGQWPAPVTRGIPFNQPSAMLNSHETQSHLSLFPTNGRPWRLCVRYRAPLSKWDTKRLAWAQSLYKKKLTWAGRWLLPPDRTRTVVTEERRQVSAHRSSQR